MREYPFIFDDLDKALAQKPDIVFITNPGNLHIEVARKAAEAGCHLFIEKPLGIGEEGVDELIELVERKRLVALVAYQLRFHPGLQQVENWLKEERIGQLIFANLSHHLIGYSELRRLLRGMGERKTNWGH